MISKHANSVELRLKRRVNTFGLNFGLYQGHIWPKSNNRRDRAMSQLSFDVIKRVWPKSGLTTFLKSTPEVELFYRLFTINFILITDL